MLNFIFMIGFSLYLAGYGFIALFKQEWLANLRTFSARVEGKGDIKREEVSEGLSGMRQMIAIVALVLGVIGLVMSVATMVIAIQAANGPISV